MQKLHLYLTLFFAFLLGTHEGFVAIWIPPDAEPAEVFPYSVASLPLQDQQLLQKGIFIRSEEELMGLLEDYLS